MHKKIEPSKSYFANEKTKEDIYKSFKNKLDSGLIGLIISRTNSFEESIIEPHPEIKFIQLGTQKNSNIKTAVNFNEIMASVKEHITNSPQSIIILERIDYLITMFNYNEFLKFLYSLNDLICNTKSSLIVLINPELMNFQQMALIEQELEPVPIVKEKTEILSMELQEIIEAININLSNNIATTYKDIIEKFNITSTTARKRIEILKDKGYIHIQKSGREKQIVLTNLAESLFSKQRNN